MDIVEGQIYHAFSFFKEYEGVQYGQAMSPSSAVETKQKQNGELDEAKDLFKVSIQLKEF